MTTPADEIRTAATRLRAIRFTGAMTLTPAVAMLIGAREPLADLLDFEACLHAAAPHTTIGPRLDRVLDIARLINQEQPHGV